MMKWMDLDVTLSKGKEAHLRLYSSFCYWQLTAHMILFVHMNSIVYCLGWSWSGCKPFLRDCLGIELLVKAVSDCFCIICFLPSLSFTH